MVNYQNGKIYKIVNDELNLTYYGSTCSTLTRRLSAHKTSQNRCSSKVLFTTETNAEIFLVEKFPCNDKEELHQRERFYIENNDCINKVIPNRKTKESKRAYDLRNKEKIQKYNKEYWEKNKELVIEKYKEMRSEKFNCECGGKYRYTDKWRHLKTIKHQNFINSV
tara:strand:- start:73 stop:570 length:498 start_codon:yes stop_codon:yes gene_type:complete